MSLEKPEKELLTVGLTRGSHRYRKLKSEDKKFRLSGVILIY